MKKSIFCAIFCFAITLGHGQALDSVQLFINSIEESLKYETGIIKLASDNATLTVPEGFHYLDKVQSMYVLSDLWGNPSDSSILGMLVPIHKGVLDQNAWVFTINFDEMGYVKDDDAEDINYDNLLKDMQKEAKDANSERIKEGYEPFELVGWAATPHYDKGKKILHWAKEIKFGKDSINTLNYNLRILGRKGIFELNAISSMTSLDEVSSNIDKVITSVQFDTGHKYSDFIPDVDNVAAWSIGGLVAGKLLAKAGLFVFLAKFWKLIVLAFIGFGGSFMKFFNRKKEHPVSKKTEEDNPIS